MWDVGCAQAGALSSLPAQPGGHMRGAGGVGPPGTPSMWNPEKSSLWSKGWSLAHREPEQCFGCIPEAGKGLTLPAAEIPCSCCGVCWWAVPSWAGRALGPLCAQVGSAGGERAGSQSWAGILQGPGAVGHSCAAGRAGLSPSPNSLGVRGCRALVWEVFTRCV